jgi:hypothetical protein
MRAWTSPFKGEPPDPGGASGTVRERLTEQSGVHTFQSGVIGHDQVSIRLLI